MISISEWDARSGARDGFAKIWRSKLIVDAFASSNRASPQSVSLRTAIAARRSCCSHSAGTTQAISFRSLARSLPEDFPSVSSNSATYVAIHLSKKPGSAAPARFELLRSNISFDAVSRIGSMSASRTDICVDFPDGRPRGFERRWDRTLFVVVTTAGAPLVLESNPLLLCHPAEKQDAWESDSRETLGLCPSRCPRSVRHR